MLPSGRRHPSHSAERFGRLRWPRCDPAHRRREPSPHPTMPGRQSKQRCASGASSECLPNTEKYVHPRRMLRDENGGGRPIRGGHSLRAGKRRWIEVISKIEANWSDWRLVAYTNPNGVGNVVVVTLCRGGGLQASLGIFLLPALQIIQHIAPIGEDVAGVVKYGKTQVVL